MTGLKPLALKVAFIWRPSAWLVSLSSLPGMVGGTVQLGAGNTSTS